MSVLLAGLDDGDDGVRNSFGKALADVLLIAIQQNESVRN